MSDHTWLDVFRLYDPDIPDGLAGDMLWCETAYPFSDVRTTARQIHSSVRARKNGVECCELCGRKEGFCHCKESMAS